MEISYTEFKDLLTIASKEGAYAVLIELGILTSHISKSQAYKMYNRPTVDRWIKEGLIKVEKDGTNTSTGRIDRMAIYRVSNTSNRASWYNHYDKGED